MADHPRSTPRLTPILSQINVGPYSSSPILAAESTNVFFSQPTRPDHIVQRTRPDHTVHITRPEHTVHRTFSDPDHTIHRTYSTDASITEEAVDDPEVSDPNLDAPDKERVSFRSSLTVRKLLILIILVCGNISASMFYSLFAPFFATEASKKGASEFEIGLIFGIFQLIQFPMSLVFGYYMIDLGPKYLFVAGNFVCSGCAILFGFLEWCPDGYVYVLMCFVVRSVEAIAAAAENTATFSIGAHTFPDNISTVMGLLQAAGCIGLMGGPVLGGILYQAGGFYLPFTVTGGLFMFFSIASFFILPSIQEERKPRPDAQSRWRLLRLPVVAVTGFLVLVCDATLGFLDVSLSLYLTGDISRQIHKSVSYVEVGLIFLVPAAIVVFLAPIYGLIADRYRASRRPLMIFGAFIGGAAFLLVGPSPLLSSLFSPSVTMVAVGLAVSAVGWGTMVLTYQEYINAATNHGYPETMETKGIISGINGAYNSIGALLGPTVGAVMYQHLEFPWASTIMAASILLAGTCFLVNVICERIFCPVGNINQESSAEEREPLLS